MSRRCLRVASLCFADLRETKTGVHRPRIATNKQTAYTARARYGTTYLDAPATADKLVTLVAASAIGTPDTGGPEVEGLFFAKLLQDPSGLGVTVVPGFRNV